MSGGVESLSRRRHLVRHQAGVVRKAAAQCAAAACLSDFSLLRNLQRVIDLDAEVPDSAFQLDMAEQLRMAQMSFGLRDGF